MWLINTVKWQLVEVVSPETAPDFAILSHTWGDEEVSFQDFSQEPHSDRTKAKSGYRKIQQFCQIALRDFELLYCWVDTCCIDKKSSAELSEAINSMYTYYQQSDVCIVYLSDICTQDHYDCEVSSSKSQHVCTSRWFTRGWTLQELLAPNRVEMYDHKFTALGNARTEGNTKSIIKATNITDIFLTDPKNCSIAARMSWAANRRTTRTEDRAYCLMGLFDVSMPLLYGEGMKAFRRLQEEIIKSSNDESIFAWASDRNPRHRSDDSSNYAGILAPSPAAFAHSGDLVPCHPPRINPLPYMVTNYGLQMHLTIPNAVHQINKAAERLKDQNWIHRSIPFACRKRDGSSGYLKIQLGLPKDKIVYSDTQKELIFRRNPHFIEFFQQGECEDLEELTRSLYYIQLS